MDPQATNESFSMMQHLMDEMDKSNQRIDHFTSDKQFFQDIGATAPKRPSPYEKQFETLYDDAWKSEESDGLSLQEVVSGHASKDDSECDDVVNNVIAEVSKDFLAGTRGASMFALNADSDESHVSSDTDFRLVTGKPSYARYPETATGLSDSDWNPYGTESDNNTSPRTQFHDRGSEMRISDVASFNPPFNSTSFGAVTPSLALYSSPKLSMDQPSEVNETTNLHAETMKPDLTADFSTISPVSEPLVSPLRRPRDPVDSCHNKTLIGTNLLPQSLEEKLQELNQDDKDANPEENKFIASTSSTGYSSAASGPENNRDKLPKTTSGNGQYVSVIERAKLMGIPEDILLDPKSKHHDRIRETDSESKDSASPRLEYDSDDFLGRKVNSLLSETAHLTLHPRMRKPLSDRENVDYHMLQRDLQEIQDSLHRTLGDEENRLHDHRTTRKHSGSSGHDGDTIPSTTTTPEKSKAKMAWDFADLGHFDTGPGLMNDISLDTKRSSSDRLSRDKPNYTSDGDETRTSGSSAKMEDHAAADLAIAEMSGHQHHGYGNQQSTCDVDQMITSFRDQRKELENRYQTLTNQGLAEKVFRILTNQDPDSQANGILSEVNAEEREMKARLALSLHNKEFNFSSNSSHFDDSNNSLNLPDDVRKRLDLSALSSKDSSHIFDRLSFNMPPISKGFSAFDEAKRFLSSQMERAYDKTFNHSLEMRVPQSVQCYPLFVDENKPQIAGDEENSNGIRGRDENGEERHAQSFLNREGLEGNEQTSSILGAASALLTGERLPDTVPISSCASHSTSRTKENYRPYRPPGSREVYYTESDTASVADSVTTVESTHLGSDDATGPSLPSNVFGSRKDPPSSSGIYSSRKHLLTAQDGKELPPIQETAVLDEQESDRTSSQKSGGNEDTKDANVKKDSHLDSHPSRNLTSQDSLGKQGSISDKGNSDEGVSINVRAEYTEPEAKLRTSPGIEAARRNAKWANREEENRMTHSDLVSDVRPSVLGNFSRSVPPYENRQDVLGLEERPPLRSTQTYKLPSDAFVTTSSDSGGKDVVEDSVGPLSLHIELKHSPKRDVEDLKKTLPKSVSGYRSRSPVEFRRSGYRSLLPDQVDPYTGDMGDLRQGLTRSWSDENLYSPSRNARISPAFREALSPDLMSAIGRRSPLIGQDIRRSLAQPAAEDVRPRQEKDYEEAADRILNANRSSEIRERERIPSPYHTSAHSGPAHSNYFTRDSHESDLCPNVSNHRAKSNLPASSSSQEAHVSRAQLLANYSRERTPPKRNSSLVESLRNGNTSTGSPKRKVELTLEGMTSESEDHQDIDNEPLNRRVRLLKDALVNEPEPGVSRDINSLWEQFQAINESHDSSLNSGRMEAVADLLRSPTRHYVSEYIKEREQYRTERQERAQIDRERRLKEQERLLHKSRQSTSEEELSGSYVDLLAKKEEERMKRRASKKKKGGIGADADKSSKSSHTKVPQDKDKAPENLFVIPEDISFDKSPSKTPSKKHKVSRKPDTIDPNMMKLKEKIACQKKKIDKEMLQEIKKIEKLKKLEQLLLAKRRNQISQKQLEEQLDELSTTSVLTSDLSQEGGDKDQCFTPYSDDSTTAKDSSADMLTQKMQKAERMKGSKGSVTQSKFSSTADKRHLRSTSQAGLLKLVKDGYLSIDEAYNLAKTRDALDESGTPSDLSKASSDDSFFNSIRNHRFYSPYSRSDHISKSRHVSKLKGVSPKQRSYTSSQKLSQCDDHSSIKRKQNGWLEENNSQNSSIDAFDSILGRGRMSVKEIPPKQYGRQPPPSLAPEQTRESHRRKSQSPILREKMPDNARARSLSRERGKEASASYKTARPRSIEKSGKACAHHGKAEQRSLRIQFSENDPPRKKTDIPLADSVAWHIPMEQPAKHQKKQKANPLQEIHPAVANVPSKRHQEDVDIRQLAGREYDYGKGENIWQKSDHPHGIPKLQWKEIVMRDALASKTNHYEVDPLTDRVQYILNKPMSLREQDGQSYDADVPLSKLTLQEAFMMRKQSFISKCRERQKRIFLFKENQQLQEQLRLEREAIFAEDDRLAPANLYAHPYSDNLYQPKNRILTKKEMKELTAKKYKKLTEVVEKKESDRRNVELKLNRLRARLFNKKVQKKVLLNSHLRQR